MRTSMRTIRCVRTLGPHQDSRSRAVAAGNRGRKWNPGQNQVCDVGFVFPCGSLGVLWPQPDLLRHSGRRRREERGPSTGVRVSSKRRRSPLKLTAEQVALVLTELEFRDQLLVFLDAGGMTP